MPRNSIPLTIRLPEGSLNSARFNQLYLRNKGILSSKTKAVLFQVPAKTFVVVDGTLRFLTLCNYLAFKKRKVTLEFEAPLEAGTNLAYLKRLGFFNLLNGAIKVLPENLDLKLSPKLKGRSDKLVEIQRIGFTPECEQERKDLLGAIGKRLESAFSHRTDKQRIANTCTTLMSELTENIVLHSKSAIEGYAALQRFDKNHTLLIAVSDCGLGILKTVKPKLKHKYKKLSDSRLIVAMLNNGKISKDKDGGAGLKSCATNASKYKAKVWIRLPRCSTHLQPAVKPGQYGIAYGADKLPHFPGTHIAFEYQLTEGEASA